MIRSDDADAGAAPIDDFRQRFLPRYTGAMSQCEQRLEAIAAGPGGLLGESCSHTLSAGGKRLRPLLVFLAAGGGGDADSLQSAAVAVELVHMATLVHDDVLDNAEMRRGHPTLAATYGAAVSTAAGDYLFSRAFAELARTGSARALDELAGTSLGLSRGELAQMEQAFDYSLAPEAYFERCRLKTSGLFVTACRLGALLSGADEDAVVALGEYGSYLGLAFQITDDILDFQGDASSFGKKIGTDLKDGTVTLPLITALRDDPELVKDLGPGLTDDRVDAICERVRAGESLEAAARTAYGYVERAREALTAAGGVIDTRPLELIAAMAADRKV